MNLTKDDVIKNTKSTIGYAFKNITNFEGRTARAEFWYWMVSVLILDIVLAVALSIIPMLHVLAYVFLLIILVPSISISVRRFHDIDRPGWWVAMGIVPIIGGLAILYFAYQKGTEGPNPYGPAPASIGPR